jgi:hypothetical protein
MKKYVKRPEIVDAVQWFKDGDHPNVIKNQYKQYKGFPCTHCCKNLNIHGYIPMQYRKRETEKIVVCPGDWILIDDKGEMSVLDNKTFIGCYQIQKENENG